MIPHRHDVLMYRSHHGRGEPREQNANGSGIAKMVDPWCKPYAVLAGVRVQMDDIPERPSDDSSKSISQCRELSLRALSHPPIRVERLSIGYGPPGGPGHSHECGAVRQ